MANISIPVMPPYMKPAEHDYPISPRENMLRAFRHEKPLWMPAITTDVQWVFPRVYEDVPPDFTKDGYDWFGTFYKYMEEQAGCTPEAGLFSEIGEWREKMIYPDLSKVNWKSDLEGFTRQQNKALGVRLGNGNFERLHFCEGFEQALCDILLEPEECKAFFDRNGDYKVEVFKYLHETFNLDFACHNDDWANAKSNFFSTDTFEATLLDSAVQIADAVHAAGCGYMVHCCGMMENFLPYLVNDIHADVLEIQILNDIRMILDKYGAKTTPIYPPDVQLMYNPATTAEQAREYARYIVDNFGAHTCDGSGCIIKLVGNIPESYYAFEDEIYNYSLEKYQNL